MRRSIEKLWMLPTMEREFMYVYPKFGMDCHMDPLYDYKSRNIMTNYEYYIAMNRKELKKKHLKNLDFNKMEKMKKNTYQ